MKIDLIFPALPPALDGIGDYTSRLATELARTQEVRILTAQPDATDLTSEGVQLERVFATAARTDVHGLRGPITDRRPDWVILQYNPFSYGRWGLNLSLPRALKAVKQSCPEVQLAVMVHEPFVPVTSWRFAVYTTWQRWQLWTLGRSADLLLFSIEPWARRFRSWFPNTPLLSLPVGSNIPRVPAPRATVRRSLGVPETAQVFGIFGGAHESRDLPLVRDALQRAYRTDPTLVVLYVGRSGEAIRTLLAGLPVIDAGPLPAAEVSRHFAAMDLYLAPFRDGVSTRRGSFMVGLQHGVPSVTTLGRDSDATLRDASGTAFLTAPTADAAAFTRQVHRLAADSSLRRAVGRAGAAFYQQHYSWSRISARLLLALAPPSRRATRPPRSSSSFSPVG